MNFKNWQKQSSRTRIFCSGTIAQQMRIISQDTLSSSR